MCPIKVNNGNVAQFLQNASAGVPVVVPVLKPITYSFLVQYNNMIVRGFMIYCENM